MIIWSFNYINHNHSIIDTICLYFLYSTNKTW